MEEYYLGIDIGGTKCAVVLGTKNVQILERLEIPTNHAMPPEQFITKQLIGLCRELMDAYQESGEFRAVGISCGGPLNDKEGVILSPPNLPGWDEIHITAIVQEELHVPAYLQNDANACAIAEWKFGAGRGCSNMIFLTFGTGLGAGLILNGSLYSGTTGMAGEIGHMRLSEGGPKGYGKAGSFEGYCSGGGIKNLTAVMGKEKAPQTDSVSIQGKTYQFEEISAQLIFHAARGGDGFAKTVVERCASYLGRGLAVLIDILNPERIVLGSIFVRGEDLLRETMETYLKKEVLPASGSVCKILAAELGEQIGDIAALSVAILNGEVKNGETTAHMLSQR